MEKHHRYLDFGILCRCCDCRSYNAAALKDLPESERKTIEEICKLCIESCKDVAVND